MHPRIPSLGGWVAVSMLALMAAARAEPAVALPPTRISHESELRRLIDQDARQGFSGVVLVVERGKTVLFDGFGKPSPRRDARFWIASTGKQFTAAAIMKLAEQRGLRLDDPLGRFFPSAPKDKASISVRQLLSHTSGLGQSYVSEEQTSREIAVGRMLAVPLEGAPGSGFRYSNSNIQLSAAIVELRSGLPYSEFVRRYLWRPAGMQGTGFAGPRSWATVTPVRGPLPLRLRSSYWGEQGVYSTAGDLYHWYRALQSGRILSRKSVAILFAPQVKIGEGQAGLGWFRGTTPRGTDFLFVRGNEDFGANSLLYAYPKRDIVVVVLTHAGDADNEKSWSRKVLAEVEGALAL
jgi:CubicO group peptidase (beta-lactamase class C family)